MQALCFVVLGIELRTAYMVDVLLLYYLPSTFMFWDMFLKCCRLAWLGSHSTPASRITGIASLCQQIRLKSSCLCYGHFGKQFLLKGIQPFIHEHYPNPELHYILWEKEFCWSNVDLRKVIPEFWVSPWNHMDPWKYRCFENKQFNLLFLALKWTKAK